MLQTYFNYKPYPTRQPESSRRQNKVKTGNFLQKPKLYKVLSS